MHHVIKALSRFVHLLFSNPFCRYGAKPNTKVIYKSKALDQQDCAAIRLFGSTKRQRLLHLVEGTTIDELCTPSSLWNCVYVLLSRSILSFLSVYSC